MTNQDAYARCAELIDQADGLLITAGAGMGVDAGLPDFRGTAGFWRAYPALAQARIQFEEIASPHSFERDPELAWGFYGHRLNLYRRTEPHEGHRLLALWASRLSNGAFVFTSNVDGLFQKAGFASERIAECHGSIHSLQCLLPCSPEIWSAQDFQPQVDEAYCRLISAMPNCPRCGALARPNILMFNDWGWLAQASNAQHARLQRWLEATQRPLVIELGAGRHVPTVRHFSQSVGMPLIRINPTDPELDGAFGVSLSAGALEALKGIARALNG